MTRPRSSLAPRPGLSLVEVLATLVLVAVVLPAAMHGVSLALRAASYARHAQEASMLAEAKLNEALAARDAGALGGSGDFAPDWPEYRWQCQSGNYGSGLQEVSLTVTWLERGVERSVTLATLIFPPDTTGNAAFGGGPAGGLGGGPGGGP